MTRSYVAFAVRREQVLEALATASRNQAELATVLGVQQSCIAKVVRRMLDEGDLKLARPRAVSGYGPWPLRYEPARPLQRCST